MIQNEELIKQLKIEHIDLIQLRKSMETLDILNLIGYFNNNAYEWSIASYGNDGLQITLFKRRYVLRFEVGNLADGFKNERIWREIT